MSDSNPLVFRYVYKPEDERLAFAESEKKKRNKALAGALANGVVFAGIVGALIWGHSKTDFVLALAILALLTINLADIFRYSSEYLFGGRTFLPFSPFEVETGFDENEVFNTAAHFRNFARWDAVIEIAVKQHGIAVQVDGCRWFIPRSAFSSEIEMHKAFKQIKKMQERAKTGTASAQPAASK